MRGLVFLRMNAVHRTRVHTCRVFGADTRFSDYVCHGKSFSISCGFTKTIVPRARSFTSIFRFRAPEMREISLLRLPERHGVSACKLYANQSNGGPVRSNIGKFLCLLTVLGI